MPSPQARSPIQAIRGRLFWFDADPEDAGDAAAHFIEDGMLTIAGGHIVAVGEAPALLKTLPASAPVADHRGKLVMPGFIDPHLHFPQTQVIASYGAKLLDWLNTYTFPEELKY